MAESAILTVRLAPDELLRLDEVAARRGITRSQLVQGALRDVVAADARLREQAADALREEFRGAIKAQDTFRALASISAEFRRI